MERILLGIKENRIQFMFLVVMNLFIGAMVGVERTVLPLLGEEKFGLVSTTAALSFIISFGFSKAIVNYFAGQLADRFGRKRILVWGWFIGLLVPILLIFAPTWEVVLLANVLLGMNQGLTWSMAVNMKIDLAKPTQRGLAVGLNEFAGYSGVAVFALITGYVATISITPEPFYIGMGVAIIGLVLALFVKDTEKHLTLHRELSGDTNGQAFVPSAKEVFVQTTYRNPKLSAFSFAGLATNFKDGMAWGLFPLYFTTAGLSFEKVGILIAVYPAAWGLFQLFIGKLSDMYGRKGFIVSGMLLQASALWLLLVVDQFALWLLSAVLLGIGTALVYPTLQAAISDVAAPSWRASSMGVYRFWRDSGYAFGAIMAGVVTDWLSLGWAIGLVAVVPFMAGVLVLVRMKN